jgi:hypothetical protein
MVLGYLFYSGIGWRFGGLFHLLRKREKVGLYSYWKICTKELLNTGACFWSTSWWQLEQEDKFDRVHAAVQKARTASCLALYHVSFTFSMRETGH